MTRSTKTRLAACTAAAALLVAPAGAHAGTLVVGPQTLSSSLVTCPTSSEHGGTAVPGAYVSVYSTPNGAGVTSPLVGVSCTNNR